MFSYDAYSHPARLKSSSLGERKVDFFHKNKTWQDARNRSSGYENPDIFEQALINSKKEKSEKSQSWINLFDDIKKESSAIDIIDFGGG